MVIDNRQTISTPDSDASGMSQQRPSGSRAYTKGGSCRKRTLPASLRAGAQALTIWLLLALAARIQAQEEADEDGAGAALGTLDARVKHIKIPFRATDWEAGEAEIAELIRDNLDADLAYYRQLPPLKEHDLRRLRNMTEHFYAASVSLMVLLHNNSVYQVPSPGKGCIPWDAVDPVMKAALEALRVGMQQHGLPLPDALFVLNADDNALRICKRQRAADCSAPLFSFIKGGDLWGPPELIDLDLLVPQMRVFPKSMHSLPWSQKKGAALFRGHGFCGPSRWIDICQRVLLADLSANHNFGDILDVALTHGYKNGSTGGPTRHVPDLPPAPHMPVSAHAKWKYVLALDGISASYRLDALLGVDSLILKSDSSYFLYHQRTLRPTSGTRDNTQGYYVPFWRNSSYDVLQVLRDLQERDRETMGIWQAPIVARATEFGHRYMHLRPRLLYWRAAITRYISLFAPGEMEAMVQQAVRQVQGNAAAKYRT